MADGGDKGERIAKYLARAGVCSRRDAERLIAEGRVRVNGKTLDSPATFVKGDEAIFVDNKPVAAKAPTRLWLYHKPPGLVTTHNDDQGRETVFQALPREMPRVISVGRLDLNSEGLLLLTNDGALSRHLELPKNAMERKYRVRARGKMTQEKMDRLYEGVTIDGMEYGSIEVQIDSAQGSNTWMYMTLFEGKNREIRKVLETLGMEVNRLIRVTYGPFLLGALERGEVEEVPQTQVMRYFPEYFKDDTGA
jgi:23S rRNA pseudouridine2605 synthase